MSIRLALLFTLAATSCVAQTISFLPVTSIVTAGAHVVADCSGCVAVADINADGKQDIVFNILQPLPHTGVLLGNGDGTFRPSYIPIPAAGPVQVADVDGDGKPDLIIAEYSAWIFLNKGDGTFSTRIEVSACSSPSSYVSIQVGDFNADNRADLLCGTSFLFGNGDGSFRAGGTVGTSSLESVVLVADFNGDKIPDVLLRPISGITTVVLGHGDGTFGNELPTGYVWRPQTVWNPIAGDFNGDGKVDILGFSYRQDRIDFIPGYGDGTFGSTVETDISARPPSCCHYCSRRF